MADKKKNTKPKPKPKAKAKTTSRPKNLRGPGGSKKFSLAQGVGYGGGGLVYEFSDRALAFSGSKYLFPLGLLAAGFLLKNQHVFNVGSWETARVVGGAAMDAIATTAPPPSPVAGAGGIDFYEPATEKEVGDFVDNHLLGANGLSDSDTPSDLQFFGQASGMPGDLQFPSV